MNVHKETITIASASEGEEVRVAGTIANTSAALDAMVRKLVSGDKRPSFMYETVLGRHLRGLEITCLAAAPSLIPSKSGER